MGLELRVGRRKQLARAALVVTAAACLVTGIWGGLARLYWTLVPLTSLNVNWVTLHGSLMVCGFLGTLIAVERAAAIQHWWAYPGPAITAAGGVLLIAGFLGALPPVLFVLGAASLLGVTLSVLFRHPCVFLLIMACGAAAWLVGNLLWWQRWPIHHLVLWWIGFLLLTILAERLELNRFLLPTRVQQALILLATALFVAGMAASPFWQQAGQRVAGAGMLAVAAWLLRYDVARRTVRKQGSARFIALCLLSGYVWLALAGLSLVMHAPLPKYGSVYDMTLHAFFLGFVFSMIFGHALIVLPAVMNVHVPFWRLFYLHLALLHVSLAMRIAGDMFSQARMNGWGGMLSAVAILLFAASTAAAAITGPGSSFVKRNLFGSKPSSHA